MICFGSTNPPSLFPTLGGFPPWAPPSLEVVPLVYLYLGITAEFLCILCFQTYLGSSHFIVRFHPIFFLWAIDFNGFGNLDDPRHVLKKLWDFE